MKTEQKPSILIMAAGTGGHVFPALEVASTLTKCGFDVHWLGTKHGMEKDLVHQHGYTYHSISIQGLRGKSLRTLLKAPFIIARALWQSLNLIRHFRFDATLSMGGYVAGPGGLASFIMRTPLLVHEQNSIAGLSNRILAPLATSVMLGFKGALKGDKVLYTGNPIRKSLNAHKSQSSIRRVLIIGGSLGAKAINDAFSQALLEWGDEPIKVLHQCGARHFANLKINHYASNIEYQAVPFIKDMASAYQNADLVVARAGALTVAELCATGTPSILIPFPFAVDDHQTQNAQGLVENGGAILLKQSDLSPSILCSIIKNMDTNTLRNMAKATHVMAKLDATNRVANRCIEVINCARGNKPQNETAFSQD